MSPDLDSFCAWHRIVHTFSDTAAHQPNGVAERRIGQLTTRTPSCLFRSCLPHHLWVEAATHVAHAQNLLPSPTLLNRESGINTKKRQKSDVDVLSDLAPDMRRRIPYLLYYGDVTDDTFRLLVQQMRPFDAQVIVYPRRTSFHHLEERGVMGHFMGSGDDPSMDRVYITKGTGSTVRQYWHVVTPLVCLEMHAALMHCDVANAEVLTKQREAEQLAGDQASLAPFERGVFEVTDRDLNEVSPYQNDAFIQHVKDTATVDHVRTAPPAPAGAATVAARGATSAGVKGSIPGSASYTTSLVEHFPT